MLSARTCAYQTLLEVERNAAYVNLSLQKTLRNNRLQDRDKALCSEIVYGTVQRQRTLDALLQQVCNKPLKDLEVEILTILRMSVYQLQFLDKVPVYAVLNESVELTKAFRKRAAGFVNGVLRGFLRDERSWETKLQQIRVKSETDRVGLELSYPTWMVHRLTEVYGRERTRNILLQSNRKSRLTVRVNSLQANRNHLVEQLRGEGLEAAPSLLSPVGIRMERGLNVEQWDLFQHGTVTVQDEGAMLIAPLLRGETLVAGDKILDMCAAPGTKTTHLAELFPQATVVAADLYPHKAKLIQQAAVRLQLGNIQTMSIDARLLPQIPGYKESFAAVLLDAPCTGLGVLRHRPDIRWRRTETDIKDLAKLQSELLRAAIELVKPGGAIVYSTCTLLPEENEEVTKQVVEQSGGLVQIEPFGRDVIPAPPELTTTGFTLTPELYDTDGFYMCCLRKQA